MTEPNLNTVRAAVTPESLINEEKMSGLPVVYCEGKDDITFLRRYLCIATEQYSLKSVEGKPNLLKVMQLSILGIGLADADFDRVLGLNEDIPGLHLSDYHDIEVDLIHSDTFSYAIKSEYGDYDLKKNIKEAYEKCFTLSLLKYVNCKEELNLCFNDLKFKDWNGKTIEELLAKLLSQKNNKCEKSQENIMKLVKRYEDDAKSLCPKQFHNGKDLFDYIHNDLMEYLLKGAKKKIRKPQGREDFVKEARLAFSYEDFQRISFFKGLSKFAEKNRLDLFNLHFRKSILAKSPCS